MEKQTWLHGCFHLNFTKYLMKRFIYLKDPEKDQEEGAITLMNWRFRFHLIRQKMVKQKRAMRLATTATTPTMKLTSPNVGVVRIVVVSMGCKQTDKYQVFRKLRKVNSVFRQS